MFNNNFLLYLINMSLIKLARISINSLFILFSLLTNQYFNSIKKLENCPCNKGWKIDNGIILSNLLLLTSLLNLVIPLNKMIYSIPLIGSTYMFIYGFILFILLFTITNVSDELKKAKCKDCKTDSIKYMYDVFKDMSIKNCIYATSLLVIVSFWL